MSHLTYCLTTWGQTHTTTLQPLAIIYKQTLKVLDQKPNSTHYCTILNRLKLISWEDTIKYKNICLIHKILHNKAPPPLNWFIDQRDPSIQPTRSTTRGDLTVPYRQSTFSKQSFSVIAINNWNSLPSQLRDIHTYSTFTTHLKSWLSENYTCPH